MSSSSVAGRWSVAVCVLWILALGLCRPAAAEVTRSGVLHATVTDDFRTGESTTRYTLRSGRQRTVVRPTRLAAEPGDRVAVTGEVRADRLVGVVEGTGDDAQANLVAGPRKTAVLLITFSGNPVKPWSVAETRAEVFTAPDSVNAFYQEESYGGISLTGKLNPSGDVFGWFELDTPTAGCPSSTWTQKADEAAAAAGIDLTGYHHRIYKFPYQSSCPWLGTASLSGSQVLINGDLGWRGQALIHELGHNLGLLHAGSWTCTSGGIRVQISDSCTASEYGDPFDAMGNLDMRHNNGWNLAKLGILTPENIETVEASGTYSVRSALSPTTESTVLRIPRTRTLMGGVSSWYYLEVREKGGVFENVADLSDTGVSIRATAAGSSPETLLLDANPSTSGFHDAPLGVGQTFEGGPVRITTLTAAAGSATVSVELDEEPPTAPTGLTAAPGFEEVQLQWTASTDDFDVHRYVVFRDGSQVGISASASFLDSAVAVGDHEYVVYAEDSTGNRSLASEPVAVTVEPDEEPPTAPTDLVATMGEGGVQLQWGPSSDDFSVERYVVFRNGSEIESLAGTSYLDSFSSAGDQEYVVYAEDEARNRSPASESATARVPDVSGPICTVGSCSVTYRHTGAISKWTVPPGVNQAEFTVEGAQGGYRDLPGTILNRGGRVAATIGSLTTGDEVTVSVGGAGERDVEGGAGGFNGGGDGASGGGGGGYSSVTLDSSLMLLAGGGGGWGSSGSNSITGKEPSGGSGGRGGDSGTSGSSGSTAQAEGAVLGSGKGGFSGGAGGTGGSGGGVTGSSTCPGGTSAGASGAAGGSFTGGGGTPGGGGGGGGGGYVGGGQGGGGAHDDCGNTAGAGGGGGGSSFVAPGLSATFTGGVRRGYGQVLIAYANPVAAAERSYMTSPDRELVVPAISGVLSGASGPSGVPLTASAATPPAHGSLALDADGSFAYMPAPGYVGPDSFAYRVVDPSGHHATAQVILRVAAAPSAVISTPPGGSSFTVGHIVPTTFLCSEGAGGSGLSSCDDSTGAETGGGGSGRLDTSTPGTHAYTVTAASKDGLTGSASITYEVIPAPPKPPEDPPDAELDLSFRLQTRSLRELLRTGKLIVLTRVNKSARVALIGSANSKWNRARVVSPKTTYFPAPGKKKVTLVLSPRGRKVLRHLPAPKLAIIGTATDAKGDTATRRMALTLRR